MQRLTDNRLAVGATLAAGLGAAYFLLARASSRLTGGSIAKRDVAAAFDAYTAEKGATGTASRPTSTVVDSFYSMVSDLYEMGWGTSFHFSPPLPSKSAAAAEAAHEARLGAILAAGPGHTLLDVGCGIGGPMRVVAATTGANVTGITINEHQVKRAAVHNDKVRRFGVCWWGFVGANGRVLERLFFASDPFTPTTTGRPRPPLHRRPGRLQCDALP